MSRIRCWARRGEPVGVVLDYDGTLTPIVQRPSCARLSPRVRSQLSTLASAPWLEVAVMSGRRLHEVKQLVKLPALSYAGLHGAERQWRGLRIEHPPAQHASARLRALVRLVRAKIPERMGWWLEHKGLAIGLHHADAPASFTRALTRRTRWACQRVAGPWRIIPNRRTLEVMAVPASKADAVRWMRQRIREAAAKRAAHRGPVHLVYLGDDQTDEDAFRALTAHDLGVLIASRPRPSHAHRRLGSVAEVHTALAMLAAHVKEHF